MSTDERAGVRFPVLDGTRSSSRTGSAVVADSLEPVDAALAAEARGCTRWHQEYARYLAASTRAGVAPGASVAIAEAGLAAARDRFVLVGPDGVEVPVARWARATGTTERPFGSQVVEGRGDRLRRVEVPYRGDVLHGRTLEAQLAVWVSRGIVEPGFAEAVREVLEHPEWLDLPGHRVVLVGAGAAMGPLEQLTRWGADVVAIDVPSDMVQERLCSLAAVGSGRMTVPVDAGTGAAGADVARNLAGLRTWLTGLRDDATTVLAMHAYADGAAHVEINVAADVLADDLLAAQPDAMLAYLHTPTDSFLVPADAVDHARRLAASWRWNGPVHRVAALASGRRLFRPAYAEELTDEVGRRWGLSDALVDVQGPNYALAKRIQRWRAVVAADAGRRVSSTVAPASWTASVTKNRVLASVYAGAAPFGVEIFEADTARALMAAKLVADAFRDRPGPDTHPESVFVDAAHGGLWRQPFEPRSALGVAAVLGAPRMVVTRR